jgi:hypothetical protein
MKLHQTHLFVFLFTLIINNVFLTLSFKSDSKKTDITNTILKNNANYRKECKIKEKCRECTFEELKGSLECQSTGYKNLKLCSYYEDKQLMDENYIAEQCSDNMKINSVYLFLTFCTAIGVLSYLIRRSHKSIKLNQMLEKLTILRKHN